MTSTHKVEETHPGRAYEGAVPEEAEWYDGALGAPDFPGGEDEKKDDADNEHGDERGYTDCSSSACDLPISRMTVDTHGSASGPSRSCKA